MAVLEWSKPQERIFELGVSHGVFYPIAEGENPAPAGVVWNGLINVTETPSGGEDNKQYADNRVYANIRSESEFEASVEAFTYPDEMADCDGTAQLEPGVYVDNQLRKAFNFSYRTEVGNDNDKIDYGYKIHLVYNATPEPTEKSRDTINESPEAQTFTWDLKTEKVEVAGARPTAHIIIDSLKADPADLAALEAILYGSETEEPTMPMPDEVLAIFGD